MINVTLRPNPVKPLAQESQFGTCTYISWGQLEQALVMCGGLRMGERAEGFEIDTDGIKVIIVKA
jgi:hypothetical protein